MPAGICTVIPDKNKFIIQHFFRILKHKTYFLLRENTCKRMKPGNSAPSAGTPFDFLKR
jgi:hypothetical protein